VCGWQVKLCDPLVTRGPYLSALEMRSLYIKRYIISPSLLLTFFYLSVTHSFSVFSENITISHVAEN